MAHMSKGPLLWRLAFAMKTKLSTYPSNYNNLPIYLKIAPVSPRTVNIYNVRSLATQNVPSKLPTEAEPPTNYGLNDKLDRALYKLDMDVRRTGRLLLRDVNDIFREFQSFGSTSSSQSLLLLRCCGSLLPEETFETRTKMVTKVWEMLERQGARLDVSHYNALLKINLENEHPFSPTDFLADMENKQVEPNRVTYQRLISRYCQNGDIAGASKILTFMKEKDLPISEIVFNSLIQGHARANDLASARGVLDVMRTSKLEPSAETYTQLICAYAEKGAMEELKLAIAEAETNEVHLQDRDYLTIIHSMAVNGLEQHVDEILSKTKRSLGYNQDAMNAILMLVSANQEDIGYKILLTMQRQAKSNDQAPSAGLFFIRQLIRVGSPFERTIFFINDLKKRGLNTVGLQRATEMSLAYGKADLAEQLLTLMKEEGTALRPHYFWPIMVAHKKKNNPEGVYQTLELMTKLESKANYDTFLDYVFPALNMEDVDVVVQKLKALDYSVGAVVSPMVAYYVLNKDLHKATYLIQTFPVRLVGVQLSQSLAQAYLESNDLDSVLQILVKVNNSKDPHQQTDASGQFLYNLVRSGNSTGLNQLEEVLEKFKQKNLVISHSLSNQLQSHFKPNLSERALALLEELSTFNVEEVAEQDDAAVGRIPHPREMNLDELENHYSELKAKNMSTRGLLRRLLFQNCRFKKYERSMEIKKDMDAANFTYTPAMYAQLMDLHAHHKMLDQALEYRQKMLELDANFPLDDHKALNLAAVLASNDRCDEAVQIIADCHQKFGNRENPDTLSRNIFRLLNGPAEKGDAKAVRQLFDVVLKCGYLVPSNTVLGPLVKAHLVKDNLDDAISEFESCCKGYRCTPWKNELFHRLIHLEDAEKLQKVVDLSTEVHGEMNTMYDLAFAFIECNQVKQARKILETPGLRAKHQRLDSIATKFLESNKVTELEQLVSITNNLFDVDRDRMYQFLVRSYIKHDNADKAIGVWTTMQEENINPSDQTLHLLGNYLAKSGRQVPFEIPAPT